MPICLAIIRANARPRNEYAGIGFSVVPNRLFPYQFIRTRYRTVRPHKPTGHANYSPEYFWPIDRGGLGDG